MDARVKPGHDAEFFARALLHRFDFQTTRVTVSQRSAARIIWSARGTPYFQIRLRCASADKPRARGTPRVRGALKFTQCAQTKMLGPAGLDASRHRGLSKSVIPQVRQTQGVPRAVFIGLLRNAPGGLTFQAFSCSRSAYPPLWTQVGCGKPVTGCRHPPSRGPVARGWRAGTKRLGPPGPRAASPARRSSPATAPRPASEDAVQTPLGTEAGCRDIIALIYLTEQNCALV
jgi:hypothetical protein